MRAGAHNADVRIAATNARKIQAALRQGIDAKRVIAAYRRTQPNASDKPVQDRARARAWAMLNMRINNEPLLEVLQRTWAEGFVLGEAYGDDEIQRAREAKKAANDYIDWDNWKPGDAATATLLRPPKAFQELLGRARVTIKDLDVTGYDRVGTALADSIEQGLSDTRSARLINDAIGSPSRALTIAITETNRAMSYGAITRYRAAKLEQMEWAVSDPCPECAINSGQVIDIGGTFNSGAQMPPAHPHCRCALLPVIPEFEANENGVVDIAPKPERPIQNMYDGKTSAERLRGTPKTSAEMERLFADLKLTLAERRAFIDYQEADFFPINSALRKGEIPPKFAAEINAMDKVFAQAPRTSGSVGEYYRTLDEEVLAGLKKGDIFVEKGYMSTSISKQEALMFGEDAMYTGKVRVIDSANSPKVWLDSITQAKGRSQKEMLFARDTPMTYVGKDKEGFHVFVTNRYRDELLPVKTNPIAEIVDIAPATSTTMPYEWNPALKQGAFQFTPEEFVKAKEALPKIAQSEVKIRLGETALQSIIADGRMKTAHEVEKNFGGYSPIDSTYRNLRTKLENQTWGIPKNAVQPIYGYIETPGFINKPDVKAYGNVSIVLKDKIKNRVTFTVGDSLNSKLVPIQITKAAESKITNKELSSAVKHQEVWNPEKAEYLEAQIHGGVSVYNIERVEFLGFTPTQKTIDALKGLGIEVKFE